MVIHAPTKDDVISLDSSRDVTWLITNNPNTDMIHALKSVSLSEQPPIVFMALEAFLVRQAKTMLTDKLAIPCKQIISSGYWKKHLFRGL